MFKIKDFCVPLNIGETGKTVRTNNLVGGEVMCKKLMEMGVNKGAVIKILKNDAQNLIIKVGETRLVLDRRMAQKILVKEYDA